MSKFIVYSNKILGDAKNLRCNDTVQGKCFYDKKNINDCIDECEKTGMCTHGLFLDNNNEKICMNFSDRLLHDVSPYYKMIDKNNFSELTNIQSSVFINSNDVPSELDEEKYVKYGDIIKICCFDTNNFLSVVYDKNNIPLFVKSDKHNFNLFKIIPDVNLSQFSKNRKVKYGDNIQLVLINSNYSLNIDNSNGSDLVVPKYSKIVDSPIFYSLELENINGCKNNFVKYSDTFKILQNLIYCFYVDNEILKFQSSNINKKNSCFYFC